MRPPFSTPRLDTKSDKFKGALLQCLVKLGTVGGWHFRVTCPLPDSTPIIPAVLGNFLTEACGPCFCGSFSGSAFGVRAVSTCEVSKGNVGVMRSRDLKVITQSLVQIHKWMIMNVSCHILPEFHPHYMLWLTAFWCCNLFTWWSVALLHHVTPRNMNVAKSSVWFCVEVAW
jgi:hypothetical protein